MTSTRQTRSPRSARGSGAAAVAPQPIRSAAKKGTGKPAPIGGPADFADDAGIRVLCVDDHAVLVEGLRAKFAVEDRIRIVGSLECAELLLPETARLRPDIVLLDIEMPGPDVFEMADRLRGEHPGLRFIFLSAHIRDGYLAAAYKCGAWGYFAKGDELDDILAGIVEVARSTAGTFVMGPKVLAHCRPPEALGGRRRTRGPSATRDEERPATPLDSLSAREAEVLRLIGKGLTRVQIAEELSRSPKTIDRHQDRMLKKLGLAGRADLIRLAIREGIAEA